MEIPTAHTRDVGQWPVGFHPVTAVFVTGARVTEHYSDRARRAEAGYCAVVQMDLIRKPTTEGGPQNAAL